MSVDSCWLGLCIYIFFHVKLGQLFERSFFLFFTCLGRSASRMWWLVLGYLQCTSYYYCCRYTFSNIVHGHENKYLATINFYLCPGDLLLRALVAGDRCCKPQVLRFSPAVHVTATCWEDLTFRERVYTFVIGDIYRSGMGGRWYAIEVEVA